MFKEKMFSESRLIGLKGAVDKPSYDGEKAKSSPMSSVLEDSLDDLTKPVDAVEDSGNVVDSLLNRDASAFAEAFSQDVDDFDKAEKVWTAKTLQNFLVDLVSNMQNKDSLQNVIDKYGDRRLGGRITWVMADGSPMEISIEDFQNSKLFKQLGKYPENLIRNTNNQNNMVLVTKDASYDVPLDLFFKNSHRGFASFAKIVARTCDEITTKDLHDFFKKGGAKADVSSGFYVEDRPENEDFKEPVKTDLKAQGFDIKGDYSDPYSIDDTKSDNTKS